MARSWYSYNGLGDPLLPASYNIFFDKSGTNCVTGCAICAIYASGTGPTPSVISTNLRGYISSLVVNQISQPTGAMTIKRYVYGKTGC